MLNSVALSPNPRKCLPFFHLSQPRQICRSNPGGEPVHPTEIFVTNQRIILYNHKFFGRGTIEDLHYADILNTKMKKGILSCDIELKPKSPGNDTIVIQAVNKQKAYDINALITTGIREAACVVGGRFPQ